MKKINNLKKKEFKIYILSFVLAFSLFSCKEGGTSVKAVTSNQILFDSIVLHNVAGYYGSLNFATINGDVVLEYVNAMCNKIYFVSLSNEIIDSVYLPSILRDKKINYYIDSAKCIYAHYDDLAYVSAFKDTNSCKKYTYYSDEGVNLISSFLKFEVNNNTILMHKIPYTNLSSYSDRNVFYKENLVSMFCLKNDSLIEVDNFLHFPSSYLNKFINEIYTVPTRSKKNILCYLFSMKDSIYFYDLESKIGWQRPIKNILHNTLQSFNLDSLNYMSYCMNYELRSTKFLNILFDSSSSEYIITQTLPIPDSIELSGEMPLIEDKPILLNIADSTLSVNRKILFKSQFPNLLFTKMFFFKKRLYVPQFSKGKTTTIYIYNTDF